MHRVFVRSSKRKLGSTPQLRALLKQCVVETLRQEEISFDSEVSILLTDDEQIRVLNCENRGIDRATDVLSFPMLDWCDGKGALPTDADVDPETGAVCLGDIVLSVERARQQALEYGHSFERECAYLTVHSTLHLLGYDHTDTETRKTEMRKREERTLGILGLVREGSEEKIICLETRESV